MKITIALVGDSQVGKSKLLQSIKNEEAKPSYVPRTTTEFTINYSIKKGQSLEVQFYDTIGGYDYNYTRPKIYSKCKIIWLCYSITQPSTLSNIISKWKPEVDRSSSKLVVFLVGLKADLRKDPDVIQNLSYSQQEPVSPQAGIKIAHDLNAVKYIECSSVSHKGIDTLIHQSVLALSDDSSKSDKKSDKSDKGCLLM
ncbi:rho-related gtp-binding protein rhod [Anaeramoeba ignava]|uniref:Rho-related gtp-binding protein rhod n=1 Tax=Anaeramoeba ignava TaxID=1746090 RepID=A0A9Q0L9Z6_ANAIG|nr:rho-related gtp-binding protein rhod [Anaeramoeba ignava]